MSKETPKQKDEDSSTSKNETPVSASPIMYFLITAAKLIGWIGASVGGLAVILGVFGFLVNYGHNYMLGIDAGLRDPLEYVITGGLFFADTGYRGIILHGLGYQILLPLFVFALVFFSYILPNKQRNRVFKYMQDGALLSLIAVQILILYRLIQVLKNGGLLVYRITQTEISTHMVAANEKFLLSYYGSVAAPIFITLMVLGYWYWKSSIQFDRAYFFNHHLLLKVIVLLLCLMSIYGLPISYGVLMKPTYYPLLLDYGVEKDKGIDPFNTELTLNGTKTPARKLENQTIFLLNQSDKELIFYDRNRLEIIYVRRDTISYLRIGSSYYILYGRQDLQQSK
jgi:hypothetical protein